MMAFDLHWQSSRIIITLLQFIKLCLSTSVFQALSFSHMTIFSKSHCNKWTAPLHSTQGASGVRSPTTRSHCSYPLSAYHTFHIALFLYMSQCEGTIAKIAVWPRCCDTWVAIERPQTRVAQHMNMHVLLFRGHQPGFQKSKVAWYGWVIESHCIILLHWQNPAICLTLQLCLLFQHILCLLQWDPWPLHSYAAS